MFRQNICSRSTYCDKPVIVFYLDIFVVFL